VLLGLLILLSALALALIPLSFLSEYAELRRMFAVALVAGGLVLAALVGVITLRLGTSRRARLIIVAVVLAMYVVPLLSMRVPGTITYARFGLTVYGVVPVPFLDLRLCRNGLLWFRDKTHHVTLAEARAALSPDTQLLIIGNGWQGAVTVAPAVTNLPGVRVEIRRTPAAFKLYNKCRRKGMPVALLAHSTC
jgi:hypothetical protein